MKFLPPLLWLALATLANTASAQNNACHNDGSGRDSGICAKKAADVADAKLNAAYKSALKELSGDDASMVQAKASLIESERLWIKFRDTDCAVQNHIFEGGSMRGAIVEECLSKLTDQRTKELQDIWVP